MENSVLEIPFNKIAIGQIFLYSLLFIFTGIYLIIVSFNLQMHGNIISKIDVNFISLLLNPVTQKIVGIICILFGGIGLITIIKKMKNKRPGLIIDNIGIIDNSTGFSEKRISWKNIKKIKSFNMIIVKFIIIIIDNPDEFIKRYKGGRWDYILTGSPVNIYTNVLKCKHKELMNILQEELRDKIRQYGT
jgi:hypothetical protein